MRRSSAAAILAAMGVLGPAREASAVPVRVRGEASVRLVAFEQAGATVVRGEVVDDVGATLSGAAVVIDLGAPPGRLLPCEEGRGGARARDAAGPGGRVELTTDARGAFCARVERGPARGATVRATVAATELLDGARAEVTVEGDATGLVQTTLRFESPPTEADLDRPSVKLTATLGVRREDAERLAGESIRREGLELSVEDERGVELARATTGGDGRARFEIPTASLGDPGPGLFRVRFRGATALAPTSTSIPVVRSARVQLSLAAPPSPGDADDGVPVEVSVATSRGPVDGGVVEARAQAVAAGAADVAKGRAVVLVTTPGRRPGRVPVSLRFMPAAPWLSPGPDLETEVEIQPPSSFGMIALFGLVAGVGAWVLARWRRPPKPPEEPAPASARPPGQAEVLVVASVRGARGFRGHVIDAHEGSPIVGASLRVVAPSFSGDGTVARATTDDAGAFVLELEGPQVAGATLVVDGELHARLEQPLPSPGELRIALVTRRRALLDRLVRWARAKGAPWDGLREPTPGHVRRLAARSEAESIAGWAGAVERAAFGPEPVDRAAEEGVRAREPGPVGR